MTRIPPSILYVISARSAPEHFVQELLQRIEAGERITAREVRQEIKMLRGNTNVENPDCKMESPSWVPENWVPNQMGAHGLSLAEAVSILACGLSKSDFIRVKDIMTSSAVLEDPELAQKIVVAFVNVSAPLPERVSPDCEAVA